MGIFYNNGHFLQEVFGLLTENKIRSRGSIHQMKNVGKCKYISSRTKLHRHDIITVSAKSSSEISSITEETAGVTTDMKELLQPYMAVVLRCVLRTSSYIIL